MFGGVAASKFAGVVQMVWVGWWDGWDGRASILQPRGLSVCRPYCGRHLPSDCTLVMRLFEGAKAAASCGRTTRSNSAGLSLQWLAWAGWILLPFCRRLAALPAPESLSDAIVGQIA
jgi:hypothetical protein